ncbi:MAG: hypothetical protein HOW73_30105 [Polyangiaceae bacterium]|nr:hypothetical protein [Polyangiaceae bacterium]
MNNVVALGRVLVVSVALVGSAITSLAVTGCGSSTPEAVGPAHIEGEAAELQFGLSVKTGEGTMIAPSERAIRDALINAGFRVGDDKDADVMLELQLSDVDAPRFMKVVVNGKEQKSRKVTAALRAVSPNGNVIAQKTHTFTVDDGDDMVEETEVAPLIQHFTANKKLDKFAIERSIERAQRKIEKSKATAEPSASEAPAEQPPAPPPENTSTFVKP